MNDNICARSHLITPRSFFETRVSAGMRRTIAMQEMARVLSVKERQAWNIYNGKCPTTRGHLILLTLYETAPELRPLWDEEQ